MAKFKITTWEVYEIEGRFYVWTPELKRYFRFHYSNAKLAFLVCANLHNWDTSVDSYQLVQEKNYLKIEMCPAEREAEFV